MTVLHQREVSLRCLHGWRSMPILCCPSNKCLLRSFASRTARLHWKSLPENIELHRLGCNLCFYHQRTCRPESDHVPRGPIDVRSEMSPRAKDNSSHLAALYPCIEEWCLPEELLMICFRTSDLYPLVGRTWPSCRCNCFDYFGTYVFPCCIF